MTGIIPEVAALADEMTEWRRDLHAHPETAFEESRTSDRVAELLGEWGIEVHRGLAKTGVVGVLKNGDGPSIGLRADMDALHIEERTNLSYSSAHTGKMHACGHDGHTTMLLGAAKHLAESRNFTGTVVFIFQPAEESEGGGRVMVEEGLFEKFPMDSVYGMHNWPGMDAGTFAVRSGPMMAAFDTFEATITGRGTHAAMPHLGIDPIPCAAQIITAWQTIVSRNLDPQEPAVLSVTQINAGDTWNVLPDSVRLRGTFRSFSEDTRETIWRRMGEIGDGIAAGFGAEMELTRHHYYPPTVNTEAETEHAAAAAIAVAGVEQVNRAPVPSMGAEDFGFMLEASKGAYIWIGNGPGEGGCILHNPAYDFNDEILSAGASYWVRLAEMQLK